MQAPHSNPVRGGGGGHSFISDKSAQKKKKKKKRGQHESELTECIDQAEIAQIHIPWKCRVKKKKKSLNNRVFLAVLPEELTNIGFSQQLIKLQLLLLAQNYRPKLSEEEKKKRD